MKKMDIDYCMLVILIVKNMLNYSSYIVMPAIIENAFELLAYVCWFTSLLKLKLPKKKFFMLCLVGLICIYTGIVANTFVIFSSFMFFCLAITKRDIGKIVKIVYRTILIVLGIHTCIYLYMYFFGNVNLIRDTTGRIRHSLGFTHPNIASYYALWGLLANSYICIKNNKTKKGLIFGIVGSLLINFLTRSNTLLITYIAFLTLLAIGQTEIGRKAIKLIAQNVIIIFSLFIIIAIQLYAGGTSLGYQINRIFNQRIYYSYEAVNRYGYTILGQKYDSNINLVREHSYMSNSLILDVAYTNFLCRYGIIYIFILGYLFRKSARNLRLCRKYFYYNLVNICFV